MLFLALISLFFALPSFARLLHVSFPSLLIPLVKDHPNDAYGTKTNVTISHNIHTEVSFDVPNNIPKVAICRIAFHVNTFPIKNAPKGLKGSGTPSFHVSPLEPTIDEDKDTWSQHPLIAGNRPMATFTLAKDWSVTVDGGWFQCPFGNVAQFLLHPTGTSGTDFSFEWFELNYPWSEGGPHGITLEMYS